MNDKLILVFYLPQDVVSDINENGYEEQLHDYLKSRMGADNLPVVFYLPTDGPVKVECINPVVISEEQYKQYDKIITAVQNRTQIEVNKLKGGETDN